MRVEFFLAGIKRRSKGEGRILLGDNTDGEAVMLRVGVCISTKLP
jgi:hypothetical protein